MNKILIDKARGEREREMLKEDYGDLMWKSSKRTTRIYKEKNIGNDRMYLQISPLL